MFHQFILTFTSEQEILANKVYMSNLHGWLFREVLLPHYPDEANWLHEHPAPKPFALVPLVGPGGELSGIRVTVWGEQIAEALAAAWPRVLATEQVYPLGQQSFSVGEVARAKPIAFTQLLEKARPKARLRLRFQTPTAFKQGSSMQLFLPLPGNVFERPYQIWQTFAPPSLQISAIWPDWCQQKVMVQQHDIQTQVMWLNHRAKFIGFVGFVEFVAKSDDESLLRVWQALGLLSSYCGIGYKATMGMGAVAYLARS